MVKEQTRCAAQKLSATLSYWCKCNDRVMATFSCVALKAASGAHSLYSFIFLSLHVASKLVPGYYRHFRAPDMHKVPHMLILLFLLTFTYSLISVYKYKYHKN